MVVGLTGGGVVVGLMGGVGLVGGGVSDTSDAECTSWEHEPLIRTVNSTEPIEIAASGFRSRLYEMTTNTNRNMGSSWSPSECKISASVWRD